jgi:DNA-binding IclR family transcriptional regulator
VLPGVSSVAAPVVAGSGEVAGSVALVFLPDSRDLAETGALVVESAAVIAASLG